MGSQTESSPPLNDPLGSRSSTDPHIIGSDVAWAMVEASPDGLVVVDQQGQITLVNSQTESMFGYHRSELIGKPVEMLLPESLRTIHIAHRANFSASPSLRTMGSGLELLALRSDGTEFPVEISLSPFSAGPKEQVIAAIRDSTERVVARAREKRISARFRSAFDDGPVPMTISLISPSADRVILEANQSMADLLGYRIDDLIGRSMMEFGHPDDALADDADTKSQYVGEAETFTQRKRYLRSDGSVVWVQLTVAILEREDDSITTIAHSIDLSAEIEADRERAAKEAVLDEARRVQRRSELLEDRERIGRDMHDRVIGRLFATGMKLQATTAITTDPITIERLGSAVDEIDEGIREIRTTIYGLRSQVDWGKGAKGEILALAANHGSTLGFEPRVELSGPIDDLSTKIVDELLSALRETLVNAAKYALASAVTVAVSVGDDDVTLSVSDNGVGFASTEGSGQDESDDQFTSQGLGNLRARATSLGGHCSVVSVPDGGTAIEWCVPVRTPS